MDVFRLGSLVDREVFGVVASADFGHWPLELQEGPTRSKNMEAFKGTGFMC